MSKNNVSSHPKISLMLCKSYNYFQILIEMGLSVGRKKRREKIGARAERDTAAEAGGGDRSERLERGRMVSESERSAGDGAGLPATSQGTPATSFGNDPSNDTANNGGAQMETDGTPPQLQGGATGSQQQQTTSFGGGTVGTPSLSPNQTPGSRGMRVGMTPTDRPIASSLPSPGGTPFTPRSGIS